MAIGDIQIWVCPFLQCDFGSHVPHDICIPFISMKSELNQNISVSDHSVYDISKDEITDRRHKH